MSTAETTAARDGGEAPVRATARQWVGLIVMVIPLFMLATDVTALYLAMPAITADLAPAGSQSLWILHIGEFLTAATMITFGLLTQRVGPRRLLLGAVAAYGLASLVAAFAGEAETLIGARAALGIAAAAFTPAGLVLIRTTFRDERQYGVAFALFMAAFAGGMAAGPAVGGFILEHFWWGAVFLINVPIAGVLVLSGPFLLPRNHADPTVRLDVASVALSVAAVLALVYGMQEMADAGPAPAPMLSAAAGLVLLALFIRRQRRAAHPLLDLALFRSRTFRTLILVLFLLCLGAGFVDMLMAQHLQVVRGLRPWDAGLVLLGPAVAGTVGTAATPLVARRGPGLAVVLLLVAGLVGVVLAVRLPAASAPEAAVLLTVIALLVSPLMTLLSQRIIGAAPLEKTGPATAVQEISASLGGASSIAVLGSGALWVHRGVLRQEVSSDVEPSAVDAAAETFGAGPAVAATLPAAEAEALTQAADVGLTVATQAGYVVFGAVLLLGAAGVLLWGRLMRGDHVDRRVDDGLGAGAEASRPAQDGRLAEDAPEPPFRGG
ncbi:MFS transporter [Nesterenkonia sp. CL21]|uniref:MFS transporter n=1 Tax=Nesterenkonia sp. CL21 TaxID=3064894 RepID=UPI002879EF9E|nr:MFS transporter [Nesterenkonia sp. CL21]MDS2171111.1 MFS transporter [Nesterenkonia sp. CL21]